jgi:phage terminase large subunit-like protein
MTAANQILAYWGEIEAGRCVVSKRVKKQYARLAACVLHPEGNYIYDAQRARKPIAFIETFCKHSKGEWAGKPVVLELHQKAFISALFGFIHRETGARQYREAIFYVARKNGKSTLLAGIALYMLVADGEAGAEIYSAATKKDQARVIFDETLNMVRQSPDLSKHLKKRKTDLYFSLSFSKFQPIGKNSDTLDGLNAHCVIIDELHGIRDRNLYEVMKQSQSARRQPLLLMITTAGTIRECIFDDIYSYACNVVDGKFQDDTFLPILYELDSREEWTDPAAWPKANPALGSIKKLEDLHTKIQRAQNSPNDLSGILVKDFNIRDTISTAWLTFDDLNNEETFSVEQFKDCFAIGGADLSITTDLTCATLLMLDKATLKRYVAQMYWLPEDSLEKRVKIDKIPYDKWHEQKLLRLCSGNSINYGDVTAWFVEMANEYHIFPAWVYYDRYSAKYWVEEMENEGFNMVQCIQGAKTLSLPMQMMGADLQAKKINYNNHPILKWCLTNTGVQADRNGNIVPVKSQSAKQRIDGTASLLDAYVGLFEHYNEFVNVV